MYFIITFAYFFSFKCYYKLILHFFFICALWKLIYCSINPIILTKTNKQTNQSIKKETAHKYTMSKYVCDMGVWHKCGVAGKQRTPSLWRKLLEAIWGFERIQNICFVLVLCLFIHHLTIPGYTYIHTWAHSKPRAQGVQGRPRATGDRLQSLPFCYYLSKSLPAFVLLWQIHSSSLALLKALFTKIKDRRKHKAQHRVGARMFS